MRNAMRGFSLLELMVAVAIVGIIAAIALPAYDGYVRRANRTLAKTVLQQVAGRQESWFTDRKSYATSLTALGYPGDTFYIGKDGNPKPGSANALYAVTLLNATATGFTATATAFSAQQKKDPDCHQLRIDNTGQRTAKKADLSTDGPSDCWTR